MILKVVLRNFIKRPFLNLIKVLGLSLALGGILFITLFIKNELSFDGHHPNSHRIYRLTTTHPDFLGGKHFARIINSWYLEDLKDELPELEIFTRLSRLRGGVIKNNENYHSMTQGFGCDSAFFSIFNVNMIAGYPSILSKPGNMIISESYAKKLFGTNNPIGEQMILPEGQFYGKPNSFTIKGIMKDFPANSHFHPEFLTSPMENHNESWAWTYLLLTENADTEKICSSIVSRIAEQNNVKTEEVKSTFYLQKLTDIHLHSNKLREIESNGNMTNIYVLAIAALILLIIALSNFANLNAGMAGYSAKYLSVNKVMGSSKASAIRYFGYDSFLIIVITLLITSFTALVVNTYISNHYNISLLKGNALFISITVSLFTILTVLFGLVPAFGSRLDLISGQTKSKLATSKQNNRKTGTKGLIVVQYAFSIALIIGVIVISRQNKLAFDSGMGAKKDNVVVFESVHASVQQKFELFKNELLKYQSIEYVSSMMEPPGGEANDMFEFEMEGYEKTEGDDQFDRIGIFPCDYSFASLFNMEFLAGKNFTESNVDNEGSGEYIINESAMRRLHYTNPQDIVGKTFKLNFSYAPVEIPRGKIIGVVKDFHLSSLKKEIEPLVLFKRDKLWLLHFVVAYQPGMHQQALSDMQKVWSKLFPEYPFQQEHVGSIYQKVYKLELLQARLLAIFTFIALFICSMGLLGITLIVTQQRIKEIGIRKVNGAKLKEILYLLNRDIMIWVFIALIIASPVAYFAMKKWLENFAYQTMLSWWIFAIAGLVAILIAMLTISWQSLKAARRNPIDALRYE